MADTNTHGLSRHIPTEIKRQVRRRSRFGCVVCRRGFYQYEHIDPLFEDAREHDPARICCLCGGCHDDVTRGRISKALVAVRYTEVQQSSPESVQPPIGPLDFHDGRAELAIGRLLYSPAVESVLQYHGRNIIRVQPSKRLDEPGKITASFTDHRGEEILRLEENEWVGSLNAWDIDVVGPKLTVRHAGGSVALQLRLDPPDGSSSNGWICASATDTSWQRRRPMRSVDTLVAEMRCIGSTPISESLEAHPRVSLWTSQPPAFLRCGMHDGPAGEGRRWLPRIGVRSSTRRLELW